MSAPLLEARHITKRFGGTAALRDVNFTVARGEIHALCGENGAGKSTLIRVLSGYYPWHSYEGELLWYGRPLRLSGVRAGEQAGMAVIHQELTLVSQLSVAENLFLGKLPQRGGLWDWPATIRRARAMLARFGVSIDPQAQVGDLGIAQQQLVEIARALAREPQLLILDEPTAALSASEVDLLMDALRRLRDEGVSCIYISHKLDEVQSIADRITVLRDGQSIITAPRGDLSTGDLIRHMVGRELTGLYPQRGDVRWGAAALRLEHLSAHSRSVRSVRLHNITFAVQAGEILGLGGLMGAGRSELLMHLYGLWGERTAGDVWLNAARYDAPRPRQSLRRGLMLVTEDRKRFGLVPGQSTHHNVSLSSLPAVSRGGWIDAAAEHRRNTAMLRRSRFRALSDQLAVERLSGGNQQKVVLARGLLCQPKVVLLDEPTRGVDVGARREIYEHMQQLADDGAAILWVSSELPELMGICDRILMMRSGTIVGRFPRKKGFDASRLMACATGQQTALEADDA